MAKNKQIKHLLIDVTTKGSRDAVSDLKSINSELDVLDKKAKEFGSSMSTLSKMSTDLSDNLDKITKSVSAMNRSLNGDTKTAAKNIQAYIDNLEIVTLTMKDLDVVSKRVGDNMSKVTGGVAANAQMDEFRDSLSDILYELQQLTKATHTQTEETVRLGDQLERQTDAVFDVETQTRKARKEMEAYNSAMGKTSSGSKGLINDQRRLSQGGRSGAKAFSALAFGANPLVSTYAAIAVNIYAMSEAFRVLSEASQLDRLQQQLTNFSASISGLDVANLAQNLRSASGESLALRESLEFAAKGTAFNFTAEQMENLAVGAKKASIALGLNFSDAMDRVLRGISKQEIELFDELGVVTRLTPAFQAYAAQVGKTVDQLTDYERQLALTAEVQKQLDTRFAGIDVAATAWEKLGANTKTATDNLLISISRGLEPYAEKLNDLISSANILSNSELISKKSADQAQTFAAALKAGNFGQAINSIGDIDNIIKSLDKTFDENKKKMGELSKETGFLDDRIAGFSRAWVNLSGTMSRLSGFGLGPTEDQLNTNANKLAAMTSSTGELYLLGVQQKAIEREKKELLEGQKKQIQEMVEALNISGNALGFKEIFSTETGTALITHVKGLNGVNLEMEKIGTATNKSSKPLAEVMNQLNTMSSISSKLKDIPEAIISQAKAFDELHSNMKLDKSIVQLGQFQDLIERLQKNMYELSHSDAKDNILLGGKAGGDVKELTNQISRRQAILKDMEKVGKTISQEQKDQVAREIEILQLTKDKAIEERKFLVDNNAMTLLADKELKILENKAHKESEIAELEIKQLEIRKKLAEDTGRETIELEQQIALLRQKLKLSVVPSEQRTSATNDIGLGRRVIGSAMDSAGSDKARVPLREALLQLQIQEADLLTDSLAKAAALAEIERQRAENKKAEAAAPYSDAASLAGNLQNLTGLSTLQNAGLGMAENFTSTFAAAKLAGQDFTDFLKGNSEAFQEFGISLANSANTIFQSLTDSRVSSIDQEIAAEKRRDGQSIASLDKIKKLEAKKIKEKEKAGVAQVGISTAMAVMQGYAELGPIGGSFAAAAMIALGALQISNIRKASQGQADALSGGSGSSSITGGNRDNAIDVSKMANAGEYAFVTGAAGSGTAGNFTPGRLGGGFAPAGAGVTLGERGPETVVPSVPVNVSSSGSGSTGGDIVFAPVFHSNTIDSTGMEVLFQNYSRELYSGLERELNARNKTLENI